MRVTGGGHWAEVSEAPFGWRAKNRIRDTADGPFYESFILALVTDRVTAWSLDTDPKDSESWEAVPVEFGDAVLTAALAVWTGAPDPNVSSGESKPSPQADPSETPSPS